MVQKHRYINIKIQDHKLLAQQQTEQLGEATIASELFDATFYGMNSLLFDGSSHLHQEILVLAAQLLGHGAVGLKEIERFA